MRGSIIPDRTLCLSLCMSTLIVSSCCSAWLNWDSLTPFLATTSIKRPNCKAFPGNLSKQSVAHHSKNPNICCFLNTLLHAPMLSHTDQMSISKRWHEFAKTNWHDNTENPVSSQIPCGLEANARQILSPLPKRLYLQWF